MAFGLIMLAWHDYNGWHQPRYLVYAAAIALLFGGAAIQFRGVAAKIGAAVLAAVYLVFALQCVPGILAAPRVYNSWGNFFEQFSLFAGAVIVYARLSSAWSPEMQNRIGSILVGICTASFTLEQAFYLSAYGHSCSEVASAKPDVLGGGDDCFLRTGGRGSSYESNGASHGSPADNDAGDLWAIRLDTAASFGSPQSYKLERNRRDLRDCRDSVDTRRSSRRVSA